MKLTTKSYLETFLLSVNPMSHAFENRENTPIFDMLSL